MILRKGKTKHLLESGIDCALIAVEIYNKPRAPFRVENYITNMIIAWTRVFHANFNTTIGDKYFYKKKGSKFYDIIDGERRAWELKTCITKFGKLDKPVRANLEFFIKLRNKIEHRYIGKEEIGTIIFGECQALLYNFENFIVNTFGDEFALNESLAFALQFSKLRTTSQAKASKKLLSKEVKELTTFITKYKSGLDDQTFNSQEYSIKLVAIPKVSNTNRNDLAVEFVNWEKVPPEDREKYSRLLSIIKDRTVYKEVVNAGKLRAGLVVDKVKESTDIGDFNHYDHKCLCEIFSIRPYSAAKEKDPFQTNVQYCHYDEVHDDYLYRTDWANYIIDLINNQGWDKERWKENFNNSNKLEIT